MWVRGCNGNGRGNSHHLYRRNVQRCMCRCNQENERHGEQRHKDHKQYDFHFFVQRSIQSINVLYQSALFCGFSTQWPSSGKINICEGTLCSCSAVYSCMPWFTGTRKSSSPWITRVGVLNSCENLLG